MTQICDFLYFNEKTFPPCAHKKNNKGRQIFLFYLGDNLLENLFQTVGEPYIENLQRRNINGEVSSEDDKDQATAVQVSITSVLNTRILHNQSDDLQIVVILILESLGDFNSFMILFL